MAFQHSGYYSAQQIRQNLERETAQEWGLQAFTTALAVSLVLEGRADHKNIHKAAVEMHNKLSAPAGPFQRALAVTKAARGSRDAIAAIRACATKLWNAGLDSQGSNLSKGDYDPSIQEAIVSEGILIDYLPPAHLREHARVTAERIWSALQGSRDFIEGLHALETGPPTSPMQVDAWEHKVRHFDTEFLVACEALRWGILDAFAESKVDRVGGASVIGPTMVTETATEVLFLAELLNLFPRELHATMEQRYTKILSKVSVRPYLLKGHEAMLDSINHFSKLPSRLELANLFLTSCATMSSNRDLIHYVGSNPSEQQVNLAHLSASPQYSVVYTAPLPSQGAEATITLNLFPSLGHFEVRTPGENPRILRWAVDIDGVVRSWVRGIPFDKGDLGLTADEFNRYVASLREGACAVLGKLQGIWKIVPDLFTAPLRRNSAEPWPSSPNLIIMELPETISFLVAPENQKLLAETILEPKGGGEGFSGHFIAASPQEAKMCEVRIERKFLLPPEEPPVESAPEPIEVTREVDDTFISNYCPRYTDLVNLLSKHFGVTEVEGKGSHVGLTLHGHKYPTSKNMRDGTFPITDRFIRAVLNQLRIREGDFISAVEG